MRYFVTVLYSVRHGYMKYDMVRLEHNNRIERVFYYRNRCRKQLKVEENI